MDEKPIKTEIINEANIQVANLPNDKKLLNEEIEKDIPDFVNVINFAHIPDVDVPKEECREIYYCTYCKNKYGRFEYLQIHEYIHDPGKHCPICDFTFTAKKDFIVHINGHIKEKMEDERRNLFCSFCKKPFKKKRALTLHLRVHTNERPYKCPICGKAFKQKGSLTDHNKTHTNVKDFPCKICSGSFTTASSLRRHVKRIHDAGKTYFCKICLQQLDNYTCLQLHRAEHHPETSERRQCRICSLIFKSQYAYKKHKKEHTSNGELQDECSQPTIEFRCVLCGLKFLDNKLYLEHKDGHFYYNKEEFQKAQESGSFSCKLCQRDFPNKQGLFKHMAFHMERTEKCNICHELFSYYGYSNHKRRVHLPLECKICKEIVEGKGRMFHHYKTAHRDINRFRDEKYACDICDKYYKSKYPLDMHMQINHGKSNDIKTHKCNICGRQFSARASLGVHMTRVHPTSARFKCDSCNILFTNRSNLLRHNVIYHQGLSTRSKKNKSRVCTHCNQEFRTWSLLERHRKTKHKAAKPITKFQCKLCLKYFKDFKNRLVHLENKVCTKFFEKTKKVVYKCMTCRKEFLLKNLLIAHMKVHTKFYRMCRFCSKSFARTRNIITHIRSSHPGESVYYCIFCDIEFDSLPPLRIHRYSSAHRAMTDSKIEVIEEADLKMITDEKIIKEDVEVKKEPVDES